jgi:hypothetical protein
VAAVPASGSEGVLPRALAAAAVLVAAQGAALAGAGVFFVLEILLGRADEARGAAVLAALALLAGGALVLVGRGLRARRRWSRSAALLPQLFAVPLGYIHLTGGLWYVGGPLLVWALTVLVLVLSPTVGRALQA